jgi:YbbR domain-containing protein
VSFLLKFLKKVWIFIFKDLHWKLLSLALGFVVWLVAFNSSYDNLLKNETYSRNLELVGLDILESRDIEVLNRAELESREVNITVRAPQSDHDMFINRNDAIRASVDLSDFNIADVISSDEPVEKQLEVDVDIITGERMSTSPRNVNVKFDRYEEQEFEIQEGIIGEVDTGYELISVNSQIQSVSVSAARSVIQTVAQVRAEVNVSGVTVSKDEVVALKVLDVNGNDMTEKVKLSTAEASISIVSLPHKLVPLEITHTTAAAGRVATGYVISPAEVSVVAPAEVLDALQVIRLENYDLTIRTESFPTTVKIPLPEGVTKLKNGQPDEVTVTFTIEPLIMREFAFPSARITRVGTSEFSSRLADTGDIPIVVQGAESVINGMTPSRINVEVDISGLGVGEHFLAPRVTITNPQNTGIVNAPYITVIISDVRQDTPLPAFDEYGNSFFDGFIGMSEGQTGEGLPIEPGEGELTEPEGQNNNFAEDEDTP